MSKLDELEKRARDKVAAGLATTIEQARVSVVHEDPELLAKIRKDQEAERARVSKEAAEERKAERAAIVAKRDRLMAADPNLGEPEATVMAAAAVAGPAPGPDPNDVQHRIAKSAEREAQRIAKDRGISVAEAYGHLTETGQGRTILESRRMAGLLEGR
jgi:hypothetical protein